MSVTATVITLAMLAQCEETVVSASDDEQNNAFAHAVDLHGTLLISGAPQDTNANGFAGAAYVHRFAGGSWVEEDVLVAPDGLPFDAFGRDVAIEGAIAVVGAPERVDADTLSGKVYVFRLKGGVWAFEQALVAPAVQSTVDSFGVAVDYSDGTIIVGADDYSGEGVDGHGAVFLYEREEGTEEWIRIQTILGADHLSDGANGEFGQYVAINGDYAVIGAPVAEKAFIFARNETTGVWELEDDVEENPPSATPSRFGENVSIDGEVVVVGSPSDDVMATNAGALYVYRRAAGGAWPEEQKIFASDAGSFDGFGQQNGVSCGTILTGGRGKGYVYHYDGDDWNEVDILTPSGGGEYGGTLGGANQFALSGDIAALGAAGYFNVEGVAYIMRGMSDADCNANGLPDACEILDGTASDDNGDGIPDDCTAGDVDQDGDVDVDDLLIVLSMWGECESDCDCPPDLNADGVVDVNDLLVVLANF